MNKQLSHHLHKAALPLDWIANALPSALGNIQRIETVKQRPWSQVYRIQTEGDVAYFKICGSYHRQETPLLKWLMPEHIMPDIFALDIKQSWILMADGGILFRALPQPGTYRPSIATLLSNYARL